VAAAIRRALWVLRMRAASARFELNCSAHWPQVGKRPASVGAAELLSWPALAAGSGLVPAAGSGLCRAPGIDAARAWIAAIFRPSDGSPAGDGPERSTK